MSLLTEVQTLNQGLIRLFQLVFQLLELSQCQGLLEVSSSTLWLHAAQEVLQCGEAFGCDVPLDNYRLTNGWMDGRTYWLMECTVFQEISSESKIFLFFVCSTLIKWRCLCKATGTFVFCFFHLEGGSFQSVRRSIFINCFIFPLLLLVLLLL